MLVLWSSTNAMFCVGTLREKLVSADKTVRDQTFTFAAILFSQKWWKLCYFLFALWCPPVTRRAVLLNSPSLPSLKRGERGKGGRTFLWGGNNNSNGTNKPTRWKWTHLYPFLLCITSKYKHNAETTRNPVKVWKRMMRWVSELSAMASFGWLWEELPLFSNLKLTNLTKSSSHCCCK